MKLSNFARCVIYVLSSICLGQTEPQEGSKVGLGEAERTKEITISPSMGEGYPTTAAKVEVDVRKTERTEFEKSVFHESVDASVAKKKVDDNHRRETFEESDLVTTEIHISSQSSEDHLHSVAVDRVEDEVKWARSDESDTPKTAAGEMGHGVGGLSGVEKEFFDNFKAPGGSAGHWIELRNLSQIEIVNICQSIYKSEHGREAVAYYRAERRPREFKVRLSDDQIEDLMTYVLQCNVETLQTEVEEFKISTFYAAEGDWPNDVFKLKTSRYGPSESTLEVENRIAIVF